ncbi:MAG TPA: hypothetical protein ENJ82_08660, partial [Bacteroidetes bacterium]|nr:hypothetical protein [Bacteroidota bacterium]
MRNRIICLQVLLGFFAFTHYSTAYAGNGGPDAYGYTWIDSHEPGLSFSWVDITSRPSAVQLMGLGDEGLSSYLSIGFPFQYYWNTEDHLRIGANGWISFEPGTSSNANCFQAMPQQLGGATNNTLAPFMTDLSFASNNSNFPNKGELWFWSNQLDSVVISFIDVPWWKDDSLGASPPDWEGENTFQVILSGQDSSITYQYLSLSDTAFLDRIGCNTDLVIGIENIQGVIGLQPYADSVVANNYAIKFIAPATNILPVADAYAVWSMNPESKGQFILRDSIFNVTAAIGNAGNQVVDTPVVVEARLMTQSLATLWLERDTLDSVPLGPPQLITFTNLPSLPNLGQYSLRIEVKQPGDLNIQNNKVTAELDCIPDTGAYFPLGFTQNTATASSLSWALGNNGAATYMEFPFGPIRIISAEVYIIGNDADTLTPLPSGFRI